MYNKACKVAHGGAEIQLFFLSKELGKNPDFDVSVITGDYKLKLKKKKKLKSMKLHISPLNIIHIFERNYSNQNYPYLKRNSRNNSKILLFF